jgi:hypothetical protein
MSAAVDANGGNLLTPAQMQAVINSSGYSQLFYTTNASGYTVRPGFTRDEIGLIVEDRSSIAAAGSVQGTQTASTAGNPNTTYAQYYAASAISDICIAEGGRSFALDYNVLGFTQPSALAPAGTQAFNNTSVNGFLVGFGLDPGPTGQCTVINTVDGVANTFVRNTGTGGTTVTHSPVSQPGTIQIEEFALGGILEGTITDTPDGAGGINRVVTTTVNGNAVQITQHASATDLITDRNKDGDNNDPGDYTSTGITINGQRGVNSPITTALIDEQYTSANDIIRARNTGSLNHTVIAANPTDTDGVVPSPVDLSGLADWFNSPEAQGLGIALGDVTSLIGALRSGRPLSIATSGLNILSHYSSNPVIRDLASGLTSIGSLTTQTITECGNEDTAYLIAAPAIFYWSRGLKDIQNRASNDELWRDAA